MTSNRPGPLGACLTPEETEIISETMKLGGATAEQVAEALAWAAGVSAQYAFLRLVIAGQVRPRWTPHGLDYGAP